MKCGAADRYKSGECRPCRLERSRRWSRENPEKVAAISARWSRANPDKVRDGYLRRKYGITLEQEIALREAQDGKCAICQDKPEGDWLHVDHDHETGTVRGMLCGNCNMAIGLLRESIATLTNAITYLERAGL